MHRHILDTIVILEEGDRLYPRCPKYDMFVPHQALNVQYPLTDLCRRGEDWKRLRLAEEEARAGAATKLNAYRTPLTRLILQVPWESPVGGI